MHTSKEVEEHWKGKPIFGKYICYIYAIYIYYIYYIYISNLQQFNNALQNNFFHFCQ